MRTLALVTITIMGGLALPALAYDLQGETLTVDFLVENDEIREAFIAECDNNPGELMFLPNCINALDADKAVMHKQIREALGLDQ